MLRHILMPTIRILAIAVALLVSAEPVLAGTAAFQTEVLADNPYAYYRFNETTGTIVDDIGVDGRDGEYLGGPTLGVAGAGLSSDNAAVFSGGQSVTSSNLAGFGPLMASSSYEFVFSTTNSANQMALGGVLNTGSVTGWEVGLNRAATGATSANGIRIFLRDDSNNAIGAAFDNATAFDGNFHHLLFTYGSTGATNEDRLIAYLDGVEQTLTYAGGGNSIPGTSTFSEFAFPTAFAARQNRANIDQMFTGTLDEVALYGSTLTATDAADRAAALGIVVPNQWNIDGGGSFNLATNWKDGVVPTLNALFANAVVTADATVTLDSDVSLNRVSFLNATRQYTLAGPSSLTLSGDREISTSGAHRITADILSASGIVKTGAGTLILSDAKGYTGGTDVQAGTLLLNNLDAIDNQASGVLNVGATGTVNLGSGATGTLAAELSGTGVVRLLEEIEPTDTVTIGRSNASFQGLMRIEDGTLAVTNSNALGTGGLTVNRTAIDSSTGDETGKVSLSGGVNIANEVLDIDGRSTDAVALTSSGSNAWNGVIQGQAGNANVSLINIESTSGTLTLNQVYANDNAVPNRFVFSGAGNTTITSRLSDADINIDTGVVTVKANDNVGVIKRGSGTLTIGYATTAENDYWFGPTAIEEGSIVVNSSGGTDGELRSSDILIKSGATLNVSTFTEYTQQIGQSLRGSGSINVGAGNLRLIDVSTVAPGDNSGAVGVLTVESGSVTLPDLGLGGGGAWNFDVGNSSNTAGDRLNVTAGSFTASSAGITVNVTPAHGHLDAGTRTIVSHTGGANSIMNGVTARITDVNGNPLTTRQTVAVNGDTGGQVNVVVTGEEASRTWNGNASGAWDIATSNNWQESDQQYKDLDHVTFNDAANGTTDVAVDGPRFSGSVTFANSTKDYTLSGNGGIIGTGAVNVTGTGQVTLANTGNNFSGATNIASGANLTMTSANTGAITNAGTMSLGVPVTVDAFVQNGAHSIGANNYRVFAIEAENFVSSTVNDNEVVVWEAHADANASAGQALIATPTAPNNLDINLANQNYVTYGMKFTDPGEYFFYGRFRGEDDGDSTTNNDDSLWLPGTNLGNGVTVPQAFSTKYDGDQISSARNAEGLDSDGDLTEFDWYISSGQDGGFDRIVVTPADVANGTVFQFGVATRESGTVFDKFVFVQDPDFSTDANFGTVTDMDLDGVPVITATSNETTTSVGNILNVAGDFTMSGSGSVLNMLVGTSDIHDQINVSGNLAADGVLNVESVSGSVVAEAGDVFDIFSFASITGAFDDVNLPALPLGLEWDDSSLLVTGELLVAAILLTGDYNENGVVDAADYTIWRDNLGTTNALPNDPIGGMITTAQYDQWKVNFGSSYSSGAGALGGPHQVPEPASLVILASVLAASGLTRWRPK